MALAQEDIYQIQQLINKTLSEMPEILNANVRYELDLRERTIRVEEELKHQRELMTEGFRLMDKRFEQVDKRFEQVDKRFEQMQLDMNKRFEQVDKRFEQVDKRFDQLTSRMDHFMVWSFATTLTVGGIVIASIKFL
jgi:predicted nuclease with TOPRIM domain